MSVSGPFKPTHVCQELPCPICAPPQRHKCNDCEQALILGAALAEPNRMVICLDCGTKLCPGCAKIHFGKGYQMHPLVRQQYEQEIQRLQVLLAKKP